MRAVGINRVGVLQHREGFVGVDEAAGERHFAGPSRVDVDGRDGPAAAAVVVDLSRAPGKISAARARGHDGEPCSVRADGRNLDDGNSVGRVEHQRVALGRKRIVVEIERRAAGVVGQPNHSMPGFGVDPFLA